MTEPQIPPALAAFLTTDLPAPLKALAGIAVTAVEETRELPQRIGSLPTSVVTRLAATSLQVQQQYAEWVAKGEDFLQSLKEPTDEVPEWATFDEDLPRPAAQSAPATQSALATDTAPARKGPPAKKSAPAKKSRPAKKSAPATKTAPVKKAAPTQASAPAAKSAPAKKAPAKKSAPASVADRAGGVRRGATALSSTPNVDETTEVAPLLPPRRTAPPAQSGPSVMPEFDTLTIPQLRARLKTLKLDELRQLVAHEESAAGRRPIINMLQARIETLSS